MAESAVASASAMDRSSVIIWGLTRRSLCLSRVLSRQSLVKNSMAWLSVTPSQDLRRLDHRVRYSRPLSPDFWT